ncbi:MAG: bifunctional phosphopantothenoylcysteine decarboxylase/phosphopantothenate--cysteine ligase CoaBC [SAR324 cluster bacterium]|nr:bifunctional phosphopantothenoylcysteine decarboxylase/phosphopantothenate--cysteine ligase CoaBC [SAR324 cluster bacterium]
MDWDLNPPRLSELNDHDVAGMGSNLKGKRIALMLTGSIAAYRAPDLIRSLRREGAEVTVFASKEGLRYVAREALEWTSLNRVIDEFTADAEHLSDSAPFSAYLLAPATYNTVNKMAQGIADSVVTSTLASALGKLEHRQTAVLVAPAMHGSMHNSILTESLKKLHRMGVRVIPPRQENGKNNLPSIENLLAETIRATHESPLKGVKILITGGSTPVYIDHIRYITNRFTGALAIQIAKDAYFQGAQVHLVLGRDSHAAPPYLDQSLIETYDDYVETIEKLLHHQDFAAGIFTAAVADYRPETIFSGKIPSGQLHSIKLTSTEKVIQRIHADFPDLFMVTFKYEEKVSHEELLEIVQARLNQGFPMLVANRGEETGAQGEQVAWLVEQGIAPQKMVGKPQIARTLLSRLAEKLC